MPDTLEITTESRADATIVSLRGSASLANMQALTALCTRLSASRPPMLILDCAGLEFLASLAMGQIVGLHKAIVIHKGRMVVAAPRPAVLEALKHARLDSYLKLAPDVESALSA